jgi:glucokinase
LFSYVTKRLGENYFSAETLLSGTGIPLIYDFLCEQRDENTLSDHEKNLQTPSDIVEQAGKESGGICTQCLDMFSGIVASEAANMALQYLSSGGVMIAGGISPRISSFLNSETFRHRFRERKHYSDWLASLPVAICLNTKAPLVGLQHYSSLQQ